MNKIFLSARAFILCLCVCGGVFAQSPDLFDYDRQLPLEYETGAELSRSAAATVREISYRSPKGGRVTAYLVSPRRQKKKLPLVIYLHGAGADKSQFLDEALKLAEQTKFASLLLDAPIARPQPWRRSEYDYLEADRDIKIQMVIDVRRAIDLLSATEAVAHDRMALVGYSYGATIGGILAGIEKRLKAFVLIAGSGSQMDFWHRKENPDAQNLKKILSPARFEQFIQTLAVVEPNAYIKNSAPAAVLFQFPRKDEFTPAADFKKFYDHAGQPKKALWYDSDHRMNFQAADDRVNFLAKYLKEK